MPVEEACVGPREAVRERTEEALYPESDGQPLGETDVHRDEIVEFGIQVLADHFAHLPDVYVAGNNFVYYTEGVPGDCVSPDVYVVKGVEKRKRRVYKVWAEGGRVPCFAIEVSSRKTRIEDLGSKLVIYRDDLRVPEYFIFDPLGEWLPEGLRGYRLAPGREDRIAPAGPSGRLPSRELGLELGVEEGHLRFFVPGADSPLRTRRERAEAEAARAEAESARAEAESARAQAESARAEAEASARRLAEAEVARLRAEIERLRGGERPGGPSGR
jgi:hypothetical protein